MSGALPVRPLEDRSQLLALMLKHWGSHRMMIGIRTYDCADIDALALYDEDGRTLAMASWTMDGDFAVLCALHALQPGQGAARLLLDAVKDAAKARGATRLKAMLTNDNMPGMIFYQLQGFRFSGLYVEAIDHYRSVIPTIIATGYHGIPVRDALELEIEL
ncbi:MAG: GNAT family N-acetyltransferase [Bosea sp. (in: a-proteobacteria)]